MKKNLLISIVIAILFIGCGNTTMEDKLKDELSEYGKPIEPLKVLKVEEDKNYVGVCGLFNGFGKICLYSDGERKIQEYQFLTRAEELKKEHEEKVFKSVFDEELKKANFSNIKIAHNERVSIDREYIRKKFGDIKIFAFIFQDKNYYFDKTNLKTLNFNTNYDFNQELDNNYKIVKEEEKIKEIINRGKILENLNKLAHFLSVELNINTLRFFDKDKNEFEKLLKEERDNFESKIEKNIGTIEEQESFKKHLKQINIAEKVYFEYQKRFMSKEELEKLRLKEFEDKLKSEYKKSGDLEKVKKYYVQFTRINLNIKEKEEILKKANLRIEFLQNDIRRIEKLIVTIKDEFKEDYKKKLEFAKIDLEKTKDFKNLLLGQ